MPFFDNADLELQYIIESYLILLKVKSLRYSKKKEPDSSNRFKLSVVRAASIVLYHAQFLHEMKYLYYNKNICHLLSSLL